jgi:hypothetical protein
MVHEFSFLWHQVGDRLIDIGLHVYSSQSSHGQAET